MIVRVGDRELARAVDGLLCGRGRARAHVNGCVGRGEVERRAEGWDEPTRRGVDTMRGIGSG